MYYRSLCIVLLLAPFPLYTDADICTCWFLWAVQLEDLLPYRRHCIANCDDSVIVVYLCVKLNRPSWEYKNCKLLYSLLRSLWRLSTKVVANDIHFTIKFWIQIGSIQRTENWAPSADQIATLVYSGRHGAKRRNGVNERQYLELVYLSRKLWIMY